MRGKPLAAALVGVLLTLLCGCASVTAGAGRAVAPVPVSSPGAGPTTTATTTSPSTAVPPTPASTPAAPSSTSAAPSSVAPVAGAATPCPESEPAEIMTCLQGVLSTYWSGQLNQAVSEPIVLDATPAATPAPCRPGIEEGTAITCKSDLTLYISHQFLSLIEQYFHGLDLALALASVASHEIGHVLQYTLRQPEIEQRHPSDATSQVIEQQADCLSGVWAGAAAAAHDLDVDRFVTDAERLISLVSSNPEIATHGTPPQRRAAIERGLAGASPGACHLVTFH